MARLLHGAAPAFQRSATATRSLVARTKVAANPSAYLRRSGPPFGPVVEIRSRLCTIVATLLPPEAADRLRWQGGNARLTWDSALLTGGFESCAESATTAGEPCAQLHNLAFVPLRAPCVWVMVLMRIHAWDRLSVADATATHTGKCGRVSTSRRGDLAKRMTDFGGQQ